MVKKVSLLFSVLALFYVTTLIGPAIASDTKITFPYEKIKKFLLKETRFVASPDHINGYHDEGNGKFTVYCSRLVAGNEIIGQILYQFLLLNTDSGQRWLYLGNVKSQFID